MATLRDINTTLRDQLAVQERIDANIDSYITERRQSRLAELEALREAGRGSRGSRGSGGGGLGASIGGALVGGALGRGAIGLAAMGAAIPAFFGGLVAGDAAFTWLKSMGASFDFAGLKAAAIGFSDIITEMRPESFIALAGIMGVSAVGGRRGAVGLGFMGLAISGFLGGLLAGDLLFKGVSWIGYDLDFGGLRQAAVGFSDIIMSMDKKTWIVLGGIMTASAVAGRRGAVGLGFMGLAISGFLGGLLAGDLLFEGVSALGGSLDFNNLKTMLTGFSASISALTPEAVAALGAILAGGAIVGYSPLRARSLAKGLGAIGAGMIALFGGLLVGETLSEGAAVLGANLDFANITTMFAGFSQAIGSLDENAITKLGILLGAGGVFGAVTSNRTKARVVAGVGAIGASIAAFFTAFALGGVAVDKMATDGSAISTIVRNFGDAISSLDGQAITVLGSLIGAGGVLGALTVATGGAGLAVFAGIPAIGASIAGFFVAFEGMGAVANIVGLDGSNTKTLLSNFAAGINELTGIDIGNAEAIGNGLSSLSAGMAAFFAADALGKTVGFFEGIGNKFKEGWNWIFGIEETEASKGPFAKMVEGLQPLNDLDPNLIAQMDTFGGAIDRFVTSFSGLQNLDSQRASTNLTRLMRDVGGVLGIMPFLLRGGYYRGESLGYGDNIDFGPAGSGGLLALRDEDMNALREGIGKLYGALDLSAPTLGGSLASSPATPAPMRHNLEDLYVENLMAERMIVQSPPVVVNNVSDNSTVNAPVGIRHGAGGGAFSLDPRDTMQFFLQ